MAKMVPFPFQSAKDVFQKAWCYKPFQQLSSAQATSSCKTLEQVADHTEEKKYKMG